MPAKALTKGEQNNSQIEKELLAQVFGTEKNHQYVYGRKVILWTNRKPLAVAPKRLQRHMLRLMQYDVEIKYKRGPELYLADTLSRAYLPLEHLPGKADQEAEKIQSVNFLSVSKPQIEEIREETAKILSCCLWKRWFGMDGPIKEKANLLSCANTSTWEMSWLLKMMLFSRVQSASSRWAWDPRLKRSSTDPISIFTVV